MTRKPASHNKKKPAPTAKAPAKVLLADDHFYVTESLRLRIEEKAADRFRVVAVARNGAEAVEEARRLRPDLVVLDAQMPRMDGVEALRHIKALEPPPLALILSAHEDKAFVAEALKAGADDYLFKRDLSPETILGRMEGALRGEFPDRGPLLEAVLGEFRAADGRTRAPGAALLTPTELAVLRTAARTGGSAKEIAGRIPGGRTTPRAVAAHWQRIYDKLGARSQAQAVYLAVTRGLLAKEG